MPPDSELIAFRLNNLESNTSDMAVALKSMAESFTSLVHMQEALTRAFAEIEKNRTAQEVVNADIEDRTKKMEVEMPKLKMTSDWTVTGMLGVVAIVGVAVLVLVVK